MDPWVILLAAIFLVTLVVGLTFSADPWGVAMTASSAVAVALCIVSAVLRIPPLAYIGVLGASCGGMTWAGLVQSGQSWSAPFLSAGLLGLVT